tara:strand:- start:311 stop:835 length:525 start_codon:yes stop_codon:yes gene_type:complete
MNSKSKKVLKNIVKECLIEILAEGLVGNNQATLSESRELRGTMQESYENSSSRRISEHALTQQTQVTQSKQPAQRMPSYLDSIKTGIDNASDNEFKFMKQKVQNITSDPIMSDILADTAMTTLREQKEGRGTSGAGVMVSGDQAAKIVNQSSPEELFGAQASNWANLAFAPSKR